MDLLRSSYIYLFWLLIFTLKSTIARCPNNCNTKGYCDKYSRCTCYAGYTGADCSKRTCPLGPAWSGYPVANEVAHGPAECSNRGLCDRQTGVCGCTDGYTGHACERLSCYTDCGTFGKCTSMHDYAARYRDVESNSYSYTAPWDANQVYGCVCDNKFSGYTCSSRICPEGDDPLTTGQVNDVQLLMCKSFGGNFALYYKGRPTTWIKYNARAADVATALLSIPLITNVKVSFSAKVGDGGKNYSQVCQYIDNIVSIEFTEQFGAIPPLVYQMDSTMIANNAVIYISSQGPADPNFAQFALPDGAGFVFSQIGTKEDDACSNRGLCSASDGVCSCFSTNGDSYGSSDGYGKAGLRGDCGFVSSGLTVATCPGVTPCLLHGVCDSTTHRCTCQKGFTAGDCSARTCPTAPSWFQYPTQRQWVTVQDGVATTTAANHGHVNYTECADAGDCDRTTGLCSCRSLFYGQACEYLQTDPGSQGSFCNGNGRVLSMFEMALEATINGDDAGYTYGQDPNSPYTWDANRTMGCVCDDGYYGYDCALKTCPSGDDPLTYNDHTEVQVLQCQADSGIFALTFRQQTTSPLPFNATVSMVQAALSSLSSLGKLSVYFLLNNNIPPDISLIVPPELPLPQGAPEWGAFVNKSSKANVTFVNANNQRQTVRLAGRFMDAPTPAPTLFNNNTAACNAEGSQAIVVSFDTIHGNLPAIIPDASNLFLATAGSSGAGAITVYQDGQSVLGVASIMGTTENAVCNNRGLCSESTGICSCFGGFSSSDGEGGPGLTGDCGYQRQEELVI